MVDGRIKLVKLVWRVPCGEQGFRFNGATNWIDRPEGPIEQPGNGTFTDAGRVKGDSGNGERYDAKQTLSGTFDANSVAGKSTINIRIYRADKQIDTCKGTIRFDIPKV